MIITSDIDYLGVATGKKCYQRPTMVEIMVKITVTGNRTFLCEEKSNRNFFYGVKFTVTGNRNVFPFYHGSTNNTMVFEYDHGLLLLPWYHCYHGTIPPYYSTCVSSVSSVIPYA